MVNDPKVLWDNCLRLIKENVTEQQYKTWFESIVFERFDAENRTILVKVPSMYVYEYLEQYYVGLLSMVLKRCFGQQVQLTYRVITDRAHNIGQKIEGETPAGIESKPVTERGNKTPTRILTILFYSCKSFFLCGCYNHAVFYNCCGTVMIICAYT